MIPVCTLNFFFPNEKSLRVTGQLVLEKLHDCSTQKSIRGTYPKQQGFRMHIFEVIDEYLCHRLDIVLMEQAQPSSTTMWSGILHWTCSTSLWRWSSSEDSKIT